MERPIQSVRIDRDDFYTDDELVSHIRNVILGWLRKNHQQMLPEKPYLAAEIDPLVGSLSGRNEKLLRLLLFLPSSRTLNTQVMDCHYAIASVINSREMAQMGKIAYIARDLGMIRAELQDQLGAESIDLSELGTVFYLQFQAILETVSLNGKVRRRRKRTDVLRSNDNVVKVQFYLTKMDLSSEDMKSVHRLLNSGLLSRLVHQMHDRYGERVMQTLEGHRLGRVVARLLRRLKP